MEIIFYGHDQDGEQEEVQTVRVSIDGRELGTMRLTREKATRLLRYSVASREKDFAPEVHFRGKFIGFETKCVEMEVPTACVDGKQYFAVFYHTDDDSGGDCPVENAAHDILVQELGKDGFAAGQDNAITCHCVDDESKVPALKKAWPGQEIVEMTPANFKLWAMVFGEFDPDKGIAYWYQCLTDTTPPVKRYGPALSKPGHFVFAIIDNEDECLEAEYLVYIGTMEDWKKRHVLSDHYEDADQEMLDPILEHLNLEDLQESTFECYMKSHKEDLRDRLLHAGLVEDPEFTKFLENCGS